MKTTWFWRLLVILVLIVTPLPGLLLYNAPTLWELDPLMGLGMVLGLVAFSLLLNQIMLASRPFGMDKKTGQPWYQAVHGSTGLVLIIGAIVHRVIKIDYMGYPEMDQTNWGVAGLVLALAGGLIALFFMQPGFIAKLPFIKKLRQAGVNKAGLNYPRFRMAHNVIIIAPVLISVHVFMASSTSISPAGWWYFMGYFVLALVSYGSYRLRGRNKKTAP